MSMEDKYPNWFAVTAQHNFEKHLLKYAGRECLQYLQVGAFTGDASVWLAKNVLTGNLCSLLDIDTWKGSKEEQHEVMDFADVYKTYKEKTAPYSNIIKSAIGDSSVYIQELKQRYHFIYIDGDHTTVGVILDAELGWQRLFSKGIMAFDDYNWGSNLPLHLRPRPGIDLFLLRHEGEYELLEKNEQVWIKKL